MRCLKLSTVVLGVTGGIAAYKALDIVSKLKKKNIDVHVIMTKAASKFVTPLSFQALSQNYVTIDMFAEPKRFEIRHISLAERADAFLIAPASANIIGKIANGIADDMLSTTVMATKSPVLIAPAMNTNMYENPIVQKNIAFLKSLGYYFIEPESGRLACGAIGKGKLADTESIVDLTDMLLCKKKDLKGKKVLITAGPTREDIDPVRYITNRSTGKMGYAIAKAARDRGADVILISGPVNIKAPYGVKHVNVYSAEEMYNAVLEYFDSTDILIKSAAVADYKPLNKSNIKIKKSDADLYIELTRNKDILYEIGKIKKHQIVVGFAAETNDLIENAKAKIMKKNLDYIVANDVTLKQSGFGSDNNTVKIIDKHGNITEYPNMPKEEVAHEIFNLILKNER
ncbi:bifunctional phosphopantothenoylcysteine decarboxylase/phosphopantothenate--cysteine ligase CoaBC [Caloramator sp. E03]|uniref:bifunctional phosphopantothenoylcysteine decarboxylase/phosphopantothenate--cysteine ligase CoaBC n=1 Tax=Caloramator sp. E03 TaxID=2576307 RepID=UPI001110F23C|nr:bifunctional phosphopantothenoylcysteine decarboxylase/phosphopantothenate--cysteine ligase CoaBC [Caloramator sp. E03]QCX32214.1 bifunctional phosphopantothenoylcysteine decarboxylase/phosphopantothenate--cysteine ligase CoaBC [Caloramator sp. E03]